jgi:branched-subunit amino acid ABC-type transport system permease component
MDTLLQVLMSGLTLGAMYAVGAIGLALVWGSLGMLNKTRMGRAIRATAQNRDAAQLMAVPVGRVFAQVLALAGIVAAVSGVMLSSLTTLAPTMGYDPMLKAFIICVIAGLGNVAGSCYAAFAQMIGADGIGIYRMVPYWLLGLAILFPLCWLYGRFKHSRSPGSLWRFL